jgi:hypothetical protein
MQEDDDDDVINTFHLITQKPLHRMPDNARNFTWFCHTGIYIYGLNAYYISELTQIFNIPLTILAYV